MIAYKIIHHIPGRIRVEVPSLKELLMKDLKRSPVITFPSGIKDIRINPLNYNIVISYDPENIDIMKYLKDLSSNKELQDIIGKGGKDELQCQCSIVGRDQK
jgi:hypothetical protein